MSTPLYGLYGPTRAIDTPVSVDLKQLPPKEYSQFFYFSKSIRKLYPPGTTLVITPTLLHRKELEETNLDGVLNMFVMVPEVCTDYLLLETIRRCKNLIMIFTPYTPKIFDTIYTSYDQVETSGWANISFVLHNCGVPVLGFK